MARVRANRAARRRRHGAPSPAGRNIPSEYSIAPGLPGGAPYVPMVELEADATRWMDAVATLHPGMTQRAVHATRLRIPATQPRLRHAREAAPGGLGKGVLLGEFTAAPVRSEIILPERATPGGLILPERAA